MNDDELRRLFSDAVSDVEPDDRIDQIRSSVRSDPKVVPMSRSRSLRYAAVGVAATVAVIGGAAWATGALPGGNQADDGTPVGPGPSSQHTASTPSTPISSPTTGTSSTATTTTGTKAYAVYYVGQNPAGKPVLFREFHSGVASTPTIELAVAGLSTLPLDPDYRTSWHAGVLASATLDLRSGVIDVALGTASVHDRPAGMSAAYARASIQQVIYTAQAAFQKRLPVQFTFHGNPIDQVLGVPTSEPLSQGKVLETLSLVNISNPNEGQQVSGKLVVTGVNNSFEGTSVIYLQRHGKKYLMTPTIGGMGGNKLYPWTVTLDLSKVAPGRYTLVAKNDDPTGRDLAPYDTRTVIVK